ncbi:TcpQ domain-containing protein [Desulfovibrio falkowii]|uniref:TcpQ domain-containing protein n=1 Tax=Desulfovibrio falkowii TaxID=3136602 RepID=UPI0038B2B764
MKNIIMLFMISIMMVNYGCGFRTQHNAGGMTAYDGVSDRHHGDAQALAESTAQALALRYPPGHTSISLVSSPGVFAQALENSLRQKGFVVLPGEQSAAVRVAYILDEIQGEARCYLQIKTSDGGSFGFVRDLTNDPGTPITEPPTVYASAPQEVSIPERPLPMSSSLPVASTSELATQATLPPYTVRSTATAAKIAKRNKVPVADFCRWNNVDPQDSLHAGRRVYLKEPGIISTAPVTQHPEPTVAAAVATPTVFTPVAVARPEPLSPMPKPMDEMKPPAPTISEKVAPEPAPLPVVAAVPHPLTLESVAPPLTDTPAAPEIWNITPGTLRVQLTAWASVAGYQIIWKTDHDYDIEAHANFKGNFLSAVEQLFSGLQRVGSPLRVTLYKGNNVMEVLEN